MGAGTAHHIAFAIRDGDEQRWRDRVAAAELRLTPVMDRKANKSVYFREPSRVLFELATDQPGIRVRARRQPWRVADAGTRPREPKGRARAALPAPGKPACWNDRQGDHVLTQPRSTPVTGRNQGGKR